MRVPSALFRDVGPHAPFFPDPVLSDEPLVQRFLRLHRMLEVGAESRLRQHTHLLELLADLAARHAGARSADPPGREPRAVHLAREYLLAHAADNVSLDRLAEISGLSVFHLHRAFTAQVGLPPHAFQTQVRVARAKALLAAGMPPAEAAEEAGFADQSHLTRHFKRLVGVTPGRYARDSKNVQDRSPPHALY